MASDDRQARQYLQLITSVAVADRNNVLELIVYATHGSPTQSQIVETCSSKHTLINLIIALNTLNDSSRRVRMDGQQGAVLLRLP
jgi:hypothetical protein